MKKKLTRYIFDLKQHIHRGTTYVSLLNSGMIFFIFLDALGIDIQKGFLIIFAGGLIFLFVIGWIDIKYLKGYQEEQKLWFERNPQLAEMGRQVEDIHGRIYTTNL